MHDIWLTTEEVAELLNISCRAVRKSVQTGSYEVDYILSVGGSSGKQIRINLDSLPPEAQAIYFSEHEEVKPADFNVIEYHSTYTEKQRKEAEYKKHVIHCYWNSGCKSGAFLKRYNAEHNTDITARQLREWERKYKTSGRNVESLIDNRGGHNKGVSSIPEDVWNAFYALYMTTQKRGAKLCYDLVKKKHSDIPSYETFFRKIQTIPMYAIMKYREGKKVFNDSLPYMIRDKSDLHSNEIWCSDHHRTDLLVRNVQGNVFRPWLTVFTDIRSTKIMGFVVREEEPNTGVILKCLCLGIEKYGIPNSIYTDNGKDYKSKALDTANTNSALALLHIEKISATPYHGQAKPVERFFGTFEERFDKRFYSYLGHDAKQRPEHMQKTNIKLADDKNIPSFEEYIQKLENYINEYNSTSHSGLGMEGKSPDTVYDENLPTVIRKVTDNLTLNLICGKVVSRKVHNNGVKLFCNTFNDINGELYKYVGDTVLIRYDPENMEKVYIFDNDGKLICEAVPKLHSPFRGVNEEDYIRAGKEKKKVRKMIEEYKPQRLKNEEDYLFGNIAEEHKAKQALLEETENISISVTNAEKPAERFNPYKDMYESYKKESG